MKIDMTQTLRGFDNEPLRNEKAQPLTLRGLCCTALTANYGDEPQLSGEEKVKRFVLAQRLYSEHTPDLTAEDISLLKQLIGKGFGPAAVGPAWAALDPKDNDVSDAVHPEA